MKVYVYIMKYTIKVYECTIISYHIYYNIFLYKCVLIRSKSEFCLVIMHMPHYEIICC